MDGEWKLVKRRRRQRRKPGSKGGRHAALLLDASFLSEDDLLGALEGYKRALESFASKVVERVRELLGDRELLEIVCYGVGTFAREESRSARVQLALALLLREACAHELPLSFFDPACGEHEAEALAALGVRQLDSNDQGLRCVQGPTLLFMPHCPLQLYSNLLWANWGPRLADLVILGNTFSDYGVTVGNSSEDSGACVFLLAQLCQEIDLRAMLEAELDLESSTDEDFARAFNNTSLMSYPQLLDPHTGSLPTRPVEAPQCSEH